MSSPLHIYQNWSAKRRSNQQLREDAAGLAAQLAGDPHALQRTAEERLSALLQHAASTAPFWRDQLGVLDAADDPRAVLRALPVLEKPVVRANQADLLSAAIPETDRFMSMTGGSTAAPLEFFRNRACIRAREQNNWYLLQRIGRNPGDKFGLIWGAMRDVTPAKNARAFAYNLLLQDHALLPGNQMDPRSMARFAAQLRRFRVRFLHGYSQSIWVFARFLKAEGIKLPRLQSITATAEPLDDQQRDEISQHFGCPVFRIYGTREFGYLAAEVPGSTGYLINPLNCLVEILDPEDRPLPDGQLGQIVVTDLYNYAMPLIRYRIGDVGRILGQDAQGLPQLELTAGRETDFLALPSGRLVSGASLTLVSSPGVAQLQYLQDLEGAVTVRYTAPETVPEAELERLAEQLLAVLEEPLPLSFERVAEIKRSQSGKFTYVTSKLAQRQLRRSAP